jgi:hypothetical protein
MRTLVFYSFSCYISFMSVTQTVEIPASRRLTIEVPREVPVGRAVLTFTPVSAVKERISEEQEIELFRLHADELNAEAEDVLLYQIPIFEDDNP